MIHSQSRQKFLSVWRKKLPKTNRNSTENRGFSTNNFFSESLIFLSILKLFFQFIRRARPWKTWKINGSIAHCLLHLHGNVKLRSWKVSNVYNQSEEHTLNEKNSLPQCTNWTNNLNNNIWNITAIFIRRLQSLYTRTFNFFIQPINLIKFQLKQRIRPKSKLFSI